MLIAGMGSPATSTSDLLEPSAVLAHGCDTQLDGNPCAFHCVPGANVTIIVQTGYGTAHCGTDLVVDCTGAICYDARTSTSGSAVGKCEAVGPNARAVCIAYDTSITLTG
jgi:hypothetical protein